MYTVERRTLSAQPTAVVRGKARIPEIQAFVGHAFGAVAGVLERAGVGMAGMPFARYRIIDGDEFEVEAGFPVRVPIAPEADVEPSELPAGPAAATWHLGPYETLGAAYEALTRWIEAEGATPAGPPWEVYYTDPSDQPDPSSWRTEVFQPYLPA